MKMDVKKELKRLTGKKYIAFCKRGNEALKRAVHFAKGTLYIPDQGGWLTYTRLKNDFVKFETDYGLIKNLDFPSGSTLLVNSMPGYICYDDSEKIYTYCRQNDIVLINDVSGSIGTEQFGDFLVGSFGKWKPIDLGHGGFIASDCPIDDSYEFSDEDLVVLSQKINELPSKLEKFYKLKEEAQEQPFDFINTSKGFNAIAKYKSEEEKASIIDYCRSKSLEWTECPRYIRVLEKAISIEVKRK